MSKIKIFGDSPTIEDGLGFIHYADILFELINDFDTNSPLTVGIHGRWGSGKTSLMRMLENRFEDIKTDNFKTIWFNAWAYGRDEPIGLVLLQQILTEFQKEEKSKEKIIKLIDSSSKLLADSALRKTIGMTYVEAKDLFKNSIEVKSTLRADFETAIEECLHDARLVVFIDDLDRCLPEKTIEIIEMIKLFLDVPKCIFVIGVEKDVIERGIEVRYKSKSQEIPISGKDYIEKIIQIPFTLPPIREEEMAIFIENLGIEEREKGYIKIVSKGTGCNPRKVKMFLNTLRIRQLIAERTGGEIKPELSAKLFVFEYVFPGLYKDVIKYKGQNILCKLERLSKEKIDDEIKNELESSEILTKYHGNEDLKSLLKDKPFFCGIDIEPYIYISGTETGTETPIESILSNESILNELFSGDLIQIDHATDNINRMPDSDKQQILSFIISKLKEKDLNVTAAVALGKLNDTRAVDPLIDALKDESGKVRLSAAEALGKLDDARAFDPLINALKDKNEKVRLSAAEALGKLNDTRAVDPLINALKDENEKVRLSAAEALGKLDDARAVDPFINVLKDENENVVRLSAAEALGKLDDARAIDPLINALKDINENVRLSATEALEKFEDSRVFDALNETFLKDMNSRVRSKAAVALGILYQKQGNEDQAIELFQQSLKIIQQQEDKSGMGGTLHQLGMIYQEKGRYEEAINLFQQSLEINEKLGNINGISNDLHQLGMIYHSLGNYEEAITLFQRSRMINEKLGNRISISNDLQQLGMIYHSLGNYEEAINLFQQSLEIIEKLGDISSKADNLHQLGMIYQEKGRYEKAIELFQQSLEINEKLGDISSKADNLHQLGMVYEEMEYFPEALEKYLQTQLIFNELNDSKSNIVESSLGRLRKKMGVEAYNKSKNEIENHHSLNN